MKGVGRFGANWLNILKKKLLLILNVMDILTALAFLLQISPVEFALFKYNVKGMFFFTYFFFYSNFLLSYTNL